MVTIKYYDNDGNVKESDLSIAEYEELVTFIPEQDVIETNFHGPVAEACVDHEEYLDTTEQFFNKE